MSKKIKYEYGDILGNNDYIYLKDVENNSSHRYCLFRCNRHNKDFTAFIDNVKKNRKACPICKQFHTEYNKNDLLGPYKIKFIKYINKDKHGFRHALFECPICKQTEWDASVTTIKNGFISRCIKCNNITHGYSYTKCYNIWNLMKNRCENPKNKRYKDYGGRGIKVCDEWKSFPDGMTTFCKWTHETQKMTDDMLGRRKGQLTLDRLDVDKDYYPDNCKYRTHSEQSQNTRLIISTNKSGFRGVYYNKRDKKWVSKIGYNNKKHYLGYHTSRLKAALSYNNFVKEHKTSHPLNPIDNLSITILELTSGFYNKIKHLDLKDQIDLFDYIFKHMGNTRLIKKYLNKLNIKIDTKIINMQINEIKDVIKDSLLTDYISNDIIYIIHKKTINSDLMM